MKTLTADDSKRVRIPGAKPRQVFDYSESPDGSFVLTPVKKAEPRRIIAKLVRKNGHLIFELPKGYTIPEDSIAKGVREERDSR